MQNTSYNLLANQTDTDLEKLTMSGQFDNLIIKLANSLTWNLDIDSARVFVLKGLKTFRDDKTIGSYLGDDESYIHALKQQQVYRVCWPFYLELADALYPRTRLHTRNKYQLI